MKKLMFIALIAIATMAVMASCKNQNQNNNQETTQKGVQECSFNEYFSWSNDSLTILSESGDRIGQCAIYEIQGKNELFSHDQYVYIGLYDYFLCDDMGNPFMSYSLNEYDDYGYEDIYSGDTLKKWFIPVSMVLFSLGGAVFGMEEETLIFIPLFIPLALSLGYDSLVGVSIPFLGAWAGFCSAFMNPFTVGISQGIAQLPLYSGLGYRLLVWFICTSTVIAFVTWYGEKIRKIPQQSITYEADQIRRKTLDLTRVQKPQFKRSHLIISVVFALSMIGLVVGVAVYEWYIVEISGLFLGVGLLCALIARLSLNQTTDAIIDGARSMVSVAVMLALARAIVVIASDGRILDTVLHGIASVIGHMHPLAAVEGMFVAHSFLNFFIASGSGQAVLTMPVMIPLSDLMHISPQLSILAYQFGEGWTNAIIPTAPVTMAALGMAGIPWLKWAKWNIKLQIILAVLSALLLIPPYFMGW